MSDHGLPRGIRVRRDFLRILVLILAAAFLYQPNLAAGQEKSAPEKGSATQALKAKSANRATSPSAAKRKKADLWVPPDIDRDVPQVAVGKACAVSEVLSGAGKRVEELIHNVDKFSATEVVEHQKVDDAGRLSRPEIRKFSYLVTIAREASGNMNVVEYRNG